MIREIENIINRPILLEVWNNLKLYLIGFWRFCFKCNFRNKRYFKFVGFNFKKLQVMTAIYLFSFLIIVGFIGIIFVLISTKKIKKVRLKR